MSSFKTREAAEADAKRIWPSLPTGWSLKVQEALKGEFDYRWVYGPVTVFPDVVRVDHFYALIYSDREFHSIDYGSGRWHDDGGARPFPTPWEAAAGSIKRFRDWYALCEAVHRRVLPELPIIPADPAAQGDPRKGLSREELVDAVARAFPKSLYPTLPGFRELMLYVRHRFGIALSDSEASELREDGNLNHGR